MFEKILIANRGEIACRIIRTARRLGIRTVAVFSDADRDALHVTMADEAIGIGPAPAAQSYLRAETLIDAALDSGAAAVHPGYGFLAEQAAFAEALTAAGIVFIGPNPAAMAAMGDKINSKKMAVAAGVSTVPGHLEIIDSAEDAVAAARDLGFPVMIKASAGGGGKGMRVAATDAEVREGFDLCRSEARSSFGDDRIFVEKYIENPRHIEIQILGDKHGTIISLGERECSIQRRNQKIIEEAPSPLLDARSRAAMAEQAVRLARAVGYDSAGTVEFVAAQDKNFYFLEMNTRLQVEHPVTELVTGIDLVEQMIRIAAGEPLAMTQRDVRLSGWAIESRICSEDPRRSFLPSVGRLSRFRTPVEAADGEVTIRLDSGVTEGSEVSVHYDPLMAKLVTHAPTRRGAIDTMLGALDELVVDGVEHNGGFLSAVLGSNRFGEGRLSTGFISEEFPDGFAGVAPDREALHRLAAVALSVELVERDRHDRLAGRLRPEASPWREDWVVKVGTDYVAIRLTSGLIMMPIELDLLFGGENRPVQLNARWAPGDLLWEGRIDAEPMTVVVRPASAGWRLSWRGVDVKARAMTPALAALDRLMPAKAPSDVSRKLLCPMPGMLLSLAVAPGQEVKAGEALAIVEAMKMENVLRAERDVTIARILARPGDNLVVDAVIMEFAAPESRGR